MLKSLRDYINESQQWMDNPMPGDNFAINFREECLIESYVVETKKDAIVIQADDKMLQIMESYGCKFEDIDEEMSTDDVLVSEDPTEEEPVAPSTLGTVDEPTGYDPIGEDFTSRVLELAGCSRKTMEGDISQVEKDAADTPVAPSVNIDEGVMKGIASELGEIADTEDYDALYDLMTSTSPAGQMVQKIADEIAINHHLYDDDHEELLDRVMDRLIDDFGGQLDEAEYQGREVPLGKPMRGDVKKFKVYVKDPKTGNVKKVNFGHGGTSAKRAGQKTMKIKKSDPARRRSFRARHNCDNPGPRTKARYWSCRAW